MDFKEAYTNLLEGKKVKIKADYVEEIQWENE